MDSESSPNPFVLASIIEEGRAQEIEMFPGSGAASVLAANTILDPNTETINTSYTDVNLLTEDATIKWNQPTILVAFSAALALLSISYYMQNGSLQPQTVFSKPMSFEMFLIVIMISFFFAVSGAIFSKKHPDISRASNLVSLTSMILSFTILLWTLLPSSLSWLPWAFFAFTFLALAYHCHLCDLYRPGIMKLLNSS